MQIIKLILSIISILLLSACSDTFLRAMDEFNAGMGGQRTCTREAPYETDSYKGYSYKVGGLCNIWQGQINNYSKYTIRCENTIGGRKANTLFARPGQTTELRQIGQMNTQQLTYHCQYWERAPYVRKNHPKDGYQLLSKMYSGQEYVTLKLTGYSSKRCFIENDRRQTVVEQRISRGQVLKWVKAPKKYYYNCV